MLTPCFVHGLSLLLQISVCAESALLVAAGVERYASTPALTHSCARRGARPTSVSGLFGEAHHDKRLSPTDCTTSDVRRTASASSQGASAWTSRRVHMILSHPARDAWNRAPQRTRTGNSRSICADSACNACVAPACNHELACRFRTACVLYVCRDFLSLEDASPRHAYYASASPPTYTRSAIFGAQHSSVLAPTSPAAHPAYKCI